MLLATCSMLTSSLVTVTAQVAVKPPSTVLTVMVAVPSATAVTVPFAETVATAGLLLDHVTALLVAVAGATVIDSVSVLPTANGNVVLFSDTPVTDTVVGGGGGVEVAVHCAWIVMLAVTISGNVIAVPPVAAVYHPLKV